MRSGSTCGAAVSSAALAFLLLAATGALAADGPALYADQCARCHAADGSGDTPVGKAMKVPSLLSADWAAEDAPARIASAVNENAKHSAVKGKLDDEELAAVAAHLQGLAAGSAN